MYIMSQDGKRIERLEAVAVRHVGPDTSPYQIFHDVSDYSSVSFAEYRTEPEAKAQIFGIAKALMDGRPIYCFD